MENIVIDNFIHKYHSEIDIYERVKREIHNSIYKSLNDSGVMALVTSRVKDAGRLKEKLINRDVEKHYQNFNDIYADVVDLIGLRVALYFPNDISRVEAVIKSKFELLDIKSFPISKKNNPMYTNRFTGYSANHYRIEYEHQGVKYKVEVQVASLLMHAWAEVEHDLVYKQKKGIVSFDEYEALDEINGLVIAGEISLQRLQRVSELRMSAEKETFSNHYQLADYIYNVAKKRCATDTVNIGDAEALYKFLELKNRLTKRKVDNDISKVSFDDTISISEQIMDINASSSKSTIELMKIKVNKDPLNDMEINYLCVGKFLSEWIKLETLLNSFCRQVNLHNKKDRKDVIYFLREKNILSQQIIDEYYYLRKSRNMIVHGVEIPEEQMLLQLTERVIEIRKTIKTLLSTK